MKFINVLLAIVSTLAAVPSGWAIYAGVTGHSAFPMHPIAAGIGAIAILIVGLTASMLITDVHQFRQTAQDGAEQKNIQPLWWSWGILVLAIVSEIILSLVIVVFDGLLKFGVVVFPLMTVAGMLAASARKDLEVRVTWRVAIRAKADQIEREELAKEDQKRQAKLQQEAQEKQEQREYRRKLREERKQVPQVIAPIARKSVKDDELLAYFQANPGISDTQAAKDFGITRQAIGQRRKKLYSVTS
jgi:hypothetical protein